MTTQLVRAVKYRPFAAVRPFHDATTLESYLFGGYGAGKTTALCYEALRLSTLNPGCVGALTEPSYRMARDVLLPTFMRVLASAGVPFRVAASDLAVTLPGPRGLSTRVLIRSRDRPASLLGLNLAWAGLDELTLDPTDEALRALLSRLRDPNAKRRRLFGVGTPEGTGHWFYRTVIEPLAEGASQRSITITSVRTRDNPTLDHAYIDSLERTLPKNLARAYLDGEWVPGGAGRVYPTLDRQAHMGGLPYDAGLDLLWAHDFNVDPLCSVLVQARPRADGTAAFSVIDEIVLTGGATATDAVREFVRRYGLVHRGRVVLYGDASGGKRDTRGSVSDYAILRAGLEDRLGPGRVVVKANTSNPPLKDSVAALSALIENGRGERRLQFGPKALATFRSLEGLTWDASGLPAKDNTEHLADALRYLAWKEAPLVGARVRVG